MVVAREVFHLFVALSFATCGLRALSRLRIMSFSTGCWRLFVIVPAALARSVS
jgi:hypothetical protein